MKTVKLGKMEPYYISDYLSLVAVESSKEDKDRKMVERFPTVYISHKDLPRLKVGEEVTLKGVVTEFGEKTRKVKEDGKTSNEEHRNLEIDLTEIHVNGKEETEEKPSDEDEIDKGLNEASKTSSDDDDEEEED